ncbi:MAG: hypothetical protein RLZZ450_6613 [Pseudomonadota bacterium]|jgi:V8-like Glu-specific endopeptidase
MGRQNKNSARGLFVVAAMALVACGVEESDDSEEVPTLAVTGGTATTAMTAVGSLDFGGCTATLISSRVILTASHCMPDTSHSALGDARNPPSFPTAAGGHTFTIYTADGKDHTFDVRRYSLLQNGYGLNDLAVGELDKDVPTNIASPLRVASREPDNGAAMTTWGYGCTKLTSEYPPAGTKTTKRGTWNTERHTTNEQLNCPGDSGGPTLNSANEIVGVHSTWDGTPGYDINGLAYQSKRWISAMNAIYGKAQLCKECQQVSLKTSNGHFVRAVGGGGGNLDAQSGSVGSAERFRLVSLSQSQGANKEPWFGLQASNGQWVSAINGGGSGVTANRDFLGNWETFSVGLISFIGDVSFKTAAKQKYLSAANGGGGDVTADRSQAGDWEHLIMQ